RRRTNIGERKSIQKRDVPHGVAPDRSKRRICPECAPCFRPRNAVPPARTTPGRACRPSRPDPGPAVTQCVEADDKRVRRARPGRVKERAGILVVGGGYVGMYTALRLQRKLKRELGRGEAEITVVTPDPYMTYQPFLPEAAAGAI